MPDRYVQQVLDGDREAFRHIVRECMNGAYHLAFSILKEEHAAKDAVQNAFINAYKHLRAFRGKSSFKTWFHRIVVNEAFQLLRKRKPGLSTDSNEFESLAIDKCHVQNKMNSDHLNYYIDVSLIRMKPDESLVLKLFYLEEHTIDEITGWSKSNVKVTLHRARKSMKQLLKGTFNLKPEELYP